MNKIDKSNDIGELITALVSVQSKLPILDKGEEGYSYKYTSLSSTIESTRNVLAEVGLVVSQLTTNVGNKPAVVTILAHKSGQFISSMAYSDLVEMKSCNVTQRAGAVYSYLRRYGLQAILNLGSEDNDASSEGFTKSEKRIEKEEKPKVNYTRPKSNPTKNIVVNSDNNSSQNNEEDIF